MKLLFDQNLSYRLCDGIADLFPGSSHVRTVGLAQSTDQAIWDHAKANGFAIVTQDADFAEMAVLADTSENYLGPDWQSAARDHRKFAAPSRGPYL